MKNLWYTVLYGCTTSGGMRLCGVVICRTIVVQITKGAGFPYPNSQLYIRVSGNVPDTGFFFLMRLCGVQNYQVLWYLCYGLS